MTKPSYRNVPPIYCACGAHWEGRYALREFNPVILEHEHRAGCGFITKAEWFRRFTYVTAGGHCRVKRNR